MAEPCLRILEIRPATGFLPNSTSAKPEFITKCLMKTVSIAQELLRPFFFLGKSCSIFHGTHSLILLMNGPEI